MTALSQGPDRQRTVVVISLDGFPADALDDPKLPAPTLRKLASAGAMARRMTPVNPTVTWPNHTAIVTGVDASRHGLLANGAISRTGAWPPVKIDPWIEKEKMVHVPTVYDLARQAGLTTAQADWVAIQNAPTINWAFPEVPSPEGAVEREMIARGLTDAPSIQQFTKSNILLRDEIWTQAAVHMISEHKPNLLLLHLLTLDSIHHTYGPKSLAALSAMAFLDGCVARVLDAIRAAGLQDRATVIIVSDHGFKQVTKQVHPGVAISVAHLENAVFAIPEGGMALVYVNRTGAPDLVSTVRRLFSGVEGIAGVVGREAYESIGLPDPQRESQMSDLVLLAKAGYAFSGGNTGALVTSGAGTTGAHGYIASDPEMDAIFIASGYGIKPGMTLDRIRNVDVAPTIAELLGLRMASTIQGRAIRAILR